MQRKVPNHKARSAVCFFLFFFVLFFLTDKDPIKIEMQSVEMPHVKHCGAEATSVHLVIRARREHRNLSLFGVCNQVELVKTQR